MVTQDMLNYIKQQQGLGKSKEEITQALLASGWHKEDADEGFAAASGGAPASAMPQGTMANTTVPKASQIFSEAWTIYKNRFQTLIAITLIPGLAFFLFGGSF